MTTHRRVVASLLLVCLLTLYSSALLVLATEPSESSGDASAAAVVDLTPKNFDKLVLQSDAVWVVAFIAPWCGHCQRLHPDFEKAAKSLGGVVNFGRVNCEDHRELAAKYKVEGFPTIKIFPPFRDRKQNPLPYEGARTPQAIADAALKELPSHTVATLSDSNVDQFFSAEPQKAKVILFTNKKQMPPLVKALALDFRSSLSFALVKDSEQNLVGRWHVNKFPHLIVLPPRTATSAFADAGKDSIPYEGAMKKADIVQFLSKFAAMAPKDTPSSSSKKAPSSSSSSSSMPREVASLPPLKSDKIDSMCKGKLCVVIVVSSLAADSGVMRTAMELATVNVHDKSLKFVTVDAAADPKLAAQFSVDNHKPPLLAVLRVGKFTKFAICDQCNLSSMSDSQAFLDKVVGGNVQLSHRLSASDKPARDEL